MNIDDIAERHRKHEAITADEYAALIADRGTTNQYRSVGRGSTRFRRWQARLDNLGLPHYGRK